MIRLMIRLKRMTAIPALLAAVILPGRAFSDGHDQTASGDDRPNLIFMMADDLGYGDLTCYGSKAIETPHLDGLARSGMKFTQFYAASGVCTPTRVSCLTGRYPRRFGVDGAFLPHSDRHLLAGAVTLPRLLNEAGYATANVGKWHVGGLRYKHLEERAAGKPTIPGPHEHGFEHYLAPPVGPGPRADLIGSGKYYTQIAKHLLRNDKRAPPIDRHWTDCTIDESLTVIEKYHRLQQPLFMNVWFDAPHTPLQPAPEPHLGKYKDRAKGRDLMYRSMVSQLDAGVGRIVAKLGDLAIAENTLIIFTSDNGPLTPGSPGPLKGGKTDLFEGGIRVPMIATWPGRIKPGSVCDELAHTNDLLPTFCAAAGVPLPADVKFDGVNLLGLLTEGRPVAQRGMVFWKLHWNSSWVTQPGGRPKPPCNEVARRGKWKLLALNAKPVALYDIECDPGEKDNLLDKKPEIRRQLTADLATWLRAPRATR